MILIIDMDGKIYGAIKGTAAQVVDGNLVVNGLINSYGFDSAVRKVVRVPEQPRSSFMSRAGIFFGYYPKDVSLLYTDAELRATQDIVTERAIMKLMHPQAGIGEQIGILRDQLVQILNTLGLEPTPDFARFNEIAVTEIEKARLEKEAL